MDKGGKNGASSTKSTSSIKTTTNKPIQSPKVSSTTTSMQDKNPILSSCLFGKYK